MPHEEATIQDVLDYVKSTNKNVLDRLDRVENTHQDIIDRIENTQKDILDYVKSTHQDIIDAINGFANNTEQRLSSLEGRMGSLETKVTRIDATMVTKDYLDKKMDDMREERNRLILKGDERVSALIGELHEREVIDEKAVVMLEQLQPLRPI